MWWIAATDHLPGPSRWCYLLHTLPTVDWLPTPWSTHFTIAPHTYPPLPPSLPLSSLPHTLSDYLHPPMACVFFLLDGGSSRVRSPVEEGGSRAPSASSPYLLPPFLLLPPPPMLLIKSTDTTGEVYSVEHGFGDFLPIELSLKIHGTVCDRCNQLQCSLAGGFRMHRRPAGTSCT